VLGILEHVDPPGSGCMRRTTSLPAAGGRRSTGGGGGYALRPAGVIGDTVTPIVEITEFVPESERGALKVGVSRRDQGRYHAVGGKRPPANGREH
jgi:hypothetical protein